MVTPFCPSIAWLRGEEKVEGKGFARCRINGGSLTVPVEGGAGVLKRRGAEPVLSEHGKWRREHLGAWQAAYGRTPYYIHLMPAIEAIYAASAGKTLEQFNLELLALAQTWMDDSVMGAEQSLLAEIREELRKESDDSLSIFDAIFRLGRRASFLL